MTLRHAIGLVGLAGVLAMGCGSDGGGSSSGNNCGAACGLITQCISQSTQDCLAQCEGDLMEAAEFGGEACESAVNDLAACIAGGSCADFEAWIDEVPADSYPCRAQDMAIDDC